VAVRLLPRCAALRDGDAEVRDEALIACRLLRTDAALPEMIALLGHRRTQ
jgi:hypothetical protein